MERAQGRSVSGVKLTICLTLLGVGALSLLNTARAEGPPQTLPDGPEKPLLVAMCSGCHPAEAVLGHQNPPKYWDKEIEHMIDRGAKGKPEDFDKIAAYLKRNFSYVPATVNLPDGPGKAELIEVCSKCHNPDIVVTRDGQEGLRTQWASTIERMIRKGAKGTDKQYDLIEDYLTANFDFIPVPSYLPEGPGKKVLEKECGGCHGVALFLGRHESRDAWGRTIENMIGRGARVTPADMELMADYLTKFYGPDNLIR
jgi:mono/diheme cytochrome c family protein